MFTTALKDIKSILAEFWVKEIEMKARDSVQINRVIFLWDRPLRGEGKKIRMKSWLVMGIQWSYRVRIVNMQMIKLYPVLTLCYLFT